MNGWLNIVHCWVLDHPPLKLVLLMHPRKMLVVVLGVQLLWEAGDIILLWTQRVS